MNINIELTKHGLQQVQNFEYKVGNCLFDSIAYLLNYSIISELIWKNNMCYLQECLTIGMLQALECSSTWIKSNFFAWFTSWKNDRQSYLYTKKCHYLLWMEDYGVISLRYTRYQNIYNFQSTFGTKIIVELWWK
jgi:hypothetical protein